MALLGILCVSGAIDLIPYVGSPQLDYYPMDVLKPFWPQLLGTVPFALAGAFLAALSVACFRGRFHERAGLRKLIPAVIGWWLAALGARLIPDVLWRWPMDGQEIKWVARYALINSIAAAALLLAAHVLVGRYAVWRGRPRTRWGELALWLSCFSVTTVAFLCGMAVIGHLSPSKAAINAALLILILGVPLAVCAATAPKVRGSQASVGAEGLEPPTRPL